MYVVVKFGAHEEALFNPDCRTVSLLDEIKCKCKVERYADIELSDQQGNPKDLREHLNKYASEFLRDKEVYVLLLVENKAKGVRYIPLLEDSDVLSSDFMERLESRQQQRSTGRNSRTEKRVSTKIGGKLSARKPSRQGIR